MPESGQSVTLQPDDVERLRAQLSTFRHNANNHIALIVAATELIRRKPESAPRFVNSISEPAEKIGAEIKQFSDLLEKALGLK